MAEPPRVVTLHGAAAISFGFPVLFFVSILNTNSLNPHSHVKYRVHFVITWLGQLRVSRVKSVQVEEGTKLRSV